MQQALVHRRALLQQRQITLAAQQGLKPIGHAQGGQFRHPALVEPVAGALHQTGQAHASILAQGQHAGVVAPRGHFGRKAGGQVFEHALQIFDGCALRAGAAFAIARGRRAQQGIKLLRHHLSVVVELVQKRTGVAKTQGAGNPGQVIVLRRQHMGLLVVQVLNAVLDAAQKVVGLAQGLHLVGRHQARFEQALQGRLRGTGAQFGELTAPHHLQQLHSEFNFADTTARQLDVMRPLGVACSALGGVLADLAVQAAQRIEHAVVQITPKHKRRNHRAQRQWSAQRQIGHGRDHPAFEPRKPLPFAALHQKIFF